MCGVQHVQCKVLPVLPSRQHLKHWKHLYILRKSQYVCVCLFFLVSRMTRMILPARCAVVEAALTTFSWSDSSFFLFQTGFWSKKWINKANVFVWLLMFADIFLFLFCFLHNGKKSMIKIFDFAQIKLVLWRHLISVVWKWFGLSKNNIKQTTLLCRQNNTVRMPCVQYCNLFNCDKSSVVHSISVSSPP